MKIIHLASFLFILNILSMGCQQKTTPTVSPDFNKPGIRYLALGDSYTIGESVAEKDRYPNQLAERLKQQIIPISYLKNIAKTGWTTDELQKGIADAALKDSTFDLVSLLIGVNNQYRNRSVENYKIEFKELLNEAIKRAKGQKNRIFVVSIPDYAYTPFGGGRESISQGIDVYNAANEAICRAEGITYINITPISRNGLKDPLLVAGDQLHPSGKQYTLWVELMLPEVVKLLK